MLSWGHHEAELVWKRSLKLSHYVEDKWANLLKLASVVWDLCVWVSCNNSMPSETWLLCLVVSASESLMHPDLWCYFNFQLTKSYVLKIWHIVITNWSVIALHLVGYCSVLYFLYNIVCVKHMLNFIILYSVGPLLGTGWLQKAAVSKTEISYISWKTDQGILQHVSSCHNSSI